VYSDQFRIINPDHPEDANLRDITYRIDDVDYDATYTTGENIELSFTAWEDAGIILDPKNKFNVQAHIYKGTSLGATHAVNATFSKNRWYVSFSPVSKIGTYYIEITAYCGNVSSDSYCANTYKREQYTKRIEIEVVEKEVDDARLGLFAVPDQVPDGTAPVIRWNDIGAEYYLLSATCKGYVYTDGKARPDLCVEGEKVYGGGKDVIRVDDIYLHAGSDRPGYLQLAVTAWDGGEPIQEDRAPITIVHEYPPQTGAPDIDKVSPTQTRAGDTVTLYGSNMSSGMVVEFVGEQVTVAPKSATTDTFVFRVPEVREGWYRIRLTEKGSDMVSNMKPLYVGAPAVEKPKEKDAPKFQGDPTLRALVELLIALDLIPADKVELARSIIGGGPADGGAVDAKPIKGDGAACHVFGKDLGPGSSGEDVERLQQYLVANGYLAVPAGTVLGYFGSLTKEALMRYQVAQGISPAEGYFGAKTRASIKAFDC
jgi:hypothetical protein